jgi:5-methylcytosine-specific restriction endonuclease McrA
MTGPDTAERGSVCDIAAATEASARVPGYRAAHLRVQAARGHASSYRCTDCGRPAADWAYDNADRDELIDLVNGRPRRYSLDSDHYWPACRSCHKQRDNAFRVFRSW